ncbi:ErfK/YbiS/YcfS/YnhG family protein [hydrothermal vent metagenome]|uniref:ErfK/YbiS/YcfS/YnhG family protein n=1 Tax=hydrothermal vent metagenome TaxID=652676 RepID=A0A3B0W7F1_9ZZZZ
MNSINISVAKQELKLLDEDGLLLHQYPVSTSKYGTGSENGSEKTPLGLHRIKEKLGGAMPVNEVYIGRVPHGNLEECLEQGVELPDDVIMSRIMWLEGMEPGRNHGGYVDTYQRYIYIHGTNHEENIGTPASIGCIRMCNKDVVDLFRQVEIGSEVLIEE